MGPVGDQLESSADFLYLSSTRMDVGVVFGRALARVANHAWSSIIFPIKRMDFRSYKHEQMLRAKHTDYSPCFTTSESFLLTPRTVLI